MASNRVFEANPPIPGGLRCDDRPLGRLGQPVRRAPCKLQGIEPEQSSRYESSWALAVALATGLDTQSARPTRDRVADCITDATAEDGSTPFELFRPTTSQGRF